MAEKEVKKIKKNKSSKKKTKNDEDLSSIEKAYKEEKQQYDADLEALKQEVDDLKASNEKSTEELKNHKEEILRGMAELENFKRRKNQEVDTFKKFASENVVKEFLPVIDNFSIACEHANNHEQSESEIIKGFVLIEKQLQTTLDKLNVKMIDAIDQPFNPDFHQAIGQEKQDGVESGYILKEVQKGFMLFDKVIRPSMVIVAE